MQHIPVLLEACIEGLSIKPDGVYVDGTLGGGGHTKRILEKLDSGRLIAIDRDKNAIENARSLLAEYGETLTLIHGNFRDLDKILDELCISQVDGMLFDLGVSSPQLDQAGRGFSYNMDAPLDMRMNEEDKLTAYHLVNSWEERELRRILYEYGEERYAPLIAGAIVKSRVKQPIMTTLELSEIIRKAMPASALREKQHPAKRSFQAIRIAVNDELGAISEMLDAAVERLGKGGRLCVISFHSLEDRIVKNVFRKNEVSCVCPPDFPVCVCNVRAKLKQITRKPETANEEECERNPRARSAKLRIAEKI